MPRGYCVARKKMTTYIFQYARCHFFRAPCNHGPLALSLRFMAQLPGLGPRPLRATRFTPNGEVNRPIGGGKWSYFWMVGVAVQLLTVTLLSRSRFWKVKLFPLPRELTFSK